MTALPETTTTTSEPATATRTALFEQLLLAREAGVPEACLPVSVVEMTARAFGRAISAVTDRTDLSEQQKKTQALREVEAVVELFNDMFFFPHEEAA